MGIFRKSRGNGNWGLPEGMSLSDAAAYVVREMQHQVRLWDGAALEYIEVVEVEVDTDSPTDSREAGILMSWHHGVGRFGLLASISSLLTQSGTIDQLVADLAQTIDTPQASNTTVRTWFAGLPVAARVH